MRNTETQAPQEIIFQTARNGIVYQAIKNTDGTVNTYKSGIQFDTTTDMAAAVRAIRIKFQATAHTNDYLMKSYWAGRRF